MRTIMDWKMELSFHKCNLSKPAKLDSNLKTTQAHSPETSCSRLGIQPQFAHCNMALSCQTNHVYLKIKIHKKYPHWDFVEMNVLSFELQWQTYSKAVAKDAPPLQATPGTPRQFQRMTFYMALPFLAKLKNVEPWAVMLWEVFFNLAC